MCSVVLILIQICCMKCDKRRNNNDNSNNGSTATDVITEFMNTDFGRELIALVRGNSTTIDSTPPTPPPATTTTTTTTTTATAITMQPQSQALTQGTIY